MKLKITEARAAKLAALDEAGSVGWFVRDDECDQHATLHAERFSDGRRNAVAALDFDADDAVLAAASRNALPDLLADRAALLAALRRAVDLLRHGTERISHAPGCASGRRLVSCECWLDYQAALLVEVRALLASAEGGSDGL